MTAGRTNTTSNKEWGTPKKYVDAVRNVLGVIELDPCSNQYSIVNAKINLKLPEKDGLTEDWNYRTIFVNPPYGRDKERKTRISDWLKKCYTSFIIYKSNIIALVPVATNTKHWKEYIFGKATAICFLYDTRLKFLENGQEGGKGAPMSCVMIYWGNNLYRFFINFSKFGAVVDVSKNDTIKQRK